MINYLVLVWMRVNKFISIFLTPIIHASIFGGGNYDCRFLFEGLNEKIIDGKQSLNFRAIDSLCEIITRIVNNKYKL
jgi:hypothetical protein